MSMKTVLHANMDAMAIQMDCRDKLILAIGDINKSLEIGKNNNTVIEGQMKLFRLRGRRDKCKCGA